MENVNNLLPLAGLMLAAGLAGGVLAGLLGVGGGIVLVPVLEFILSAIGVDEAICMHVAIATSLVTIIATSISSSRAHHKKSAVDVDLMKSWAVAIFFGAVIGAIIASHLKSAVLSAIFGTVALAVALKMFMPLDQLVLGRSLPRGLAGQLLPALIGTLSAMMGIGGGTLSVPLLAFYGYPIHRAVGTASAFGVLIAVPGTISFMVAGYGDPRLPIGSIGYVNWMGLLLIAPATYFSAPWGARLAHFLTKRQLGVTFGAFLLIVAARMFYRAVWG